MFLTIACKQAALAAFLERELGIKDIVLADNARILESVEVLIEASEDAGVMQPISANVDGDSVTIRFECHPDYDGETFAEAIKSLQGRIGS